MTSPASILTAALDLPREQRAELASRLLASLDDEGTELAGPEWDAAWGAELTRRLEDFEAGRTELVPGDVSCNAHGSV